ncbi:Cytochrome c oxidase assembly protein COX14 [Caenorhabditis elegans]|uniref:Cytochrome c oxidase assembly protein COX14 n=1 Tax=Caenorhabditis elegans TaxID=6239 RepID=A2V8C7_CAEEL|nr:Cytochrome c oxidase assembly protein COX14 [Caenorhabditis elegans]CCD73990.1 Cytochrome c oxidase assembly protein COX14 [Caenorhabditis elegans]|eukprot:NP_001122797.1 Uncharacterized protein CELE_T07A9.15 [Caenorhabditis elegans]
MRIPSKIRAHAYASGLFLLVTTGAYCAYTGAMEIRKWSMSAPRLQHQEMEDYLRFKENQARGKIVRQ